jgi:hypothetical protein
MRILVFAAVLVLLQAPVPVEQEPRHRTVYADERMRVLEVVIPFGDTTLDHAHRFDIATVCVECANTQSREFGADWGPVRDRAAASWQVTEYAGKPSAHAVRTVAEGRYRLIAVENLRDREWSTAADAVSAAGTAVARETRAFRVYSVNVNPQATEISHTHPRPTVVVNPATGAWERIAPGRTHTLRAAAAPAPAQFVEIELR